MPASAPENQEWIILPSDKPAQQILDELRAESQGVEIPKNIWKLLEEKKKRGLWNGEIEVLPIKEYNLTSGKHYYVVEDARTRSVKCISCPITHGTYLEAKYLTRYKLEDGVLSFDGKPINKRAQITRSIANPVPE